MAAFEPMTLKSY